ncbi:MAG: hypothetical protein J1E16_10165 [Muribaculaceae bacterium]|nr:hypothetical protein [Muribaculaceae bacterium]
MKKFLLIGGAAAMLGLSACSTDGYSEINQKFPSSAISIITDETDGGVTVFPGTYVFNITNRDNAFSGSITSPALIANNTSLEFTSDPQSCQFNGVEFYFKDIAATAGSTGLQLNNSQILGVTSYVDQNGRYGFYTDSTEIGDLTFKPSNNNMMETVARYYIGSRYRVNTFPIDSFFLGETTTSYNMMGESHSFSTETITYRFIINKEKDSDVYTATMVMYNAKFSDNEREPLKVGIIAQGLDVNFSANGVTITGQDIIPDVYEAGATTPYENFKFNNITFQTTDIYYTRGTLDFQVAGIYKGHFEGKYLNSNFLK